MSDIWCAGCGLLDSDFRTFSEYEAHQRQCLAGRSINEMRGLMGRGGVVVLFHPDAPVAMHTLARRLNEATERTRRLSLWDAIHRAMQDTTEEDAMRKGMRCVIRARDIAPTTWDPSWD